MSFSRAEVVAVRQLIQHATITSLEEMKNMVKESAAVNTEVVFHQDGRAVAGSRHASRSVDRCE